MIALALEYGVKTVMGNHTYRFNNETYLQSDGGPIGLELTGAISRVFMLHWDRLFMEKIEEATSDIEWNLYLYMRYVDDSNWVCDELPLGARVDGNKIVVKEEYIEEDRNIASDIRTSRIMQDIANRIYDFIQVEVDCPSQHSNGKMPILDLEVKMIENKIVYWFYRKEMVNFKVLMATSAMPYSMRRISLIQEVVRILRNTSKRVETKDKIYLLNEFSLRLKLSGYKEKARQTIIKSGMEAYENQVKRDEDGIRPMYRPKGYKEEERRKKKARNKTSWYKPHDSVLFIPPTPKGELLEKMKEIVDSVGKGKITVKIVERAGKKLKSILPGLKEETNCNREDCVVHKNGGRGNCNIEGAVYRGECITCKEDERQCVYIGETGRSTYVRGKQHMTAMKNPNRQTSSSNAFAKHMIKHHNGSPRTKFRVDVVATFKKPLERQVREGIEIIRAEADELMNSKLDHYLPTVRRATFTNILDDILEEM